MLLSWSALKCGEEDRRVPSVSTHDLEVAHDGTISVAAGNRGMYTSILFDFVRRYLLRFLPVNLKR
jgi:hypothetical protein